MRYHEMDELI